eukprot:CAMPEP_0171296050 /NCGR_PEP_ID=MMETSP0816-20121228/4739_1 /TAXON_ID=420281 /ORGANISM="Proboscia inermis, Strain CCAP1064/1" /LENGTH=61 /DNA_ID=CAMNT_0011769215 /DNA_START=52 /DNA_END=234 /DNA_ORIENTATION=+
MMHRIAALLISSTACVVLAGKPINIRATLRGQTYEVSNISSLSELQASIEEQTGLSTTKQS